MTKTCTKCGLEKSLDSFSKNSKSLDGLSWWCVDCFAVYGKNRCFPVSVEEKECFGCKITKPAEEFNKSQRSKDGLAPRCRDCVKKNYLKNRDKILAQTKEYAAEHPEVGKKAKDKRQILRD